MTKPKVTSNDEFVSIWNAASKPAEVAKHYGMSTQSAFMWAYKLRNQGYSLKEYQRKINDAKFAEIWQASATLAEVAERTGLAKATCKVKAYALRKDIELKRFNESNDEDAPSMFERKGILTESKALAQVNETMQCFGLESITRQLWGQSVRPLLEKAGDAESSGGRRGQWFYDGAQMWRWSEYLAKRAVLIQLGKWSSKRPYSVEDMDNLVNVGVFDGEIDHPAFNQ